MEEREGWDRKGGQRNKEWEPVRKTYTIIDIKSFFFFFGTHSIFSHYHAPSTGSPCSTVERKNCIWEITIKKIINK